MDTRAVKRRPQEQRLPRLVYKKSVNLSDEQDRFWGVHTPELEYVYIDSEVFGSFIVADYRKKVKTE